MARRAKGAPAAPAELTPEAQRRWAAVYPDLAARGRVDLEELRSYCQVWARWREAEDGLQKAGQLSRSPQGRVVPSPLIGIANSTAAQVRHLEDRLGLAQARDLAAATSSSGALVTRRELASRLGVHMQTVTKWERDGLPIAVRGRKGKPSTYSEAAVKAWLEAREAAAAAGTGQVDVAQERARKERAQAILAEQTYQARNRELLPAAEVEKLWNAEVQAVRAAILASYTTQADRVHRAAVLDGVAGVEAVLKEVAYELLRQLASRPVAEAPVADGGQAA